MSDKLNNNVVVKPTYRSVKPWHMDMEWRRREDLAKISSSGLRNSYATYVEKQLDPPPILPHSCLFDLGKLGAPFVGAIQIYFAALILRQRIPEGWAQFERSLASQFASLIFELANRPRKNERREYVLSFMESLGLKNRPGRPRRKLNEMRICQHGRRMYELSEFEMLEAWNMKVSLEKQGKNPEVHLIRKALKEDVTREVLKRKSYEAALARVYAMRNNIAFGTARNALREYLKSTGYKLTPSFFQLTTKQKIRRS